MAPAAPSASGGFAPPWWRSIRLASRRSFGGTAACWRACSTATSCRSLAPWLTLGTAPVGTLREVIAGAEWQGVVVPWRWAYHVMEDMASALEYLHRRRMYQLDLSPKSVLVWSLFSEAEVTAKLSCSRLTCLAGRLPGDASAALSVA